MACAMIALATTRATADSGRREALAKPSTTDGSGWGRSTTAKSPASGRRHEPLLDGTVDLAIVPVSSPTPPEVMVRPIARTSMSLVCWRDDPLARARSVPLTDLRHRPFIDFPEGWGNRAIVDALFARGHVTRDVRVEVADVSTASMLIQQSLGIGFLPSDPSHRPLILKPLMKTQQRQLQNITRRCSSAANTA